MTIVKFCKSPCENDTCWVYYIESVHFLKENHHLTL